ncbi:hypothetical protein [Paraburkholderia phenoliruptrix]|uniref:Uncharacterized protein n=2 Tax=Paraburkholderia phenoliruptrix TaxID=252970 RepID=K0DMW7_9BURK|nr:hypothetical protein [Paraburkholderia phenoliruptrix]AFT87536.1 hypothetical protein BUPH_06790 [Paraburkholderia phenoliruptrix BR3459a]CAB4051030.1 hypothetical protein LMG9964_04698 [Paraburkholderia phenoliruptrix]
MNIEEALQKANLDIRLRGEDAPHQWFAYAEIEANVLCDQQDLKLNFTFNCDRRIQAYAVYESELVVVTAGLFDFLCRLTDRIVSKGLFRELGCADAPTWTPSLERSDQTPRKIIQDIPFVDGVSEWKHDPERYALFFYLLLTLFRFVVFHEMGHFYHQHGKRSSDSSASMDVDSAQPKLLPENEALDAQAREIVADKFAMDMLTICTEAEIERMKSTPFMAPLEKKLLNSKERRAQFLLQAAYIYFAATDRLPDSVPEDSIKMSHPPAAFRLVTLAAMVTEKLGNKQAHSALAATIVGDALIAVALDRQPDQKWLARMQAPTLVEHYKNLYGRFSFWTKNSPRLMRGKNE